MALIVALLCATGCTGPQTGAGTALLGASAVTGTFSAVELINIGQAALSAGDTTTAIAAANALIALGPGIPEACDAFLLLGDALVQVNDFIGARAAYQQVIVQCPARRDETLVHIGDSFRSQFSFVHGDDTGVIPVAPSADVERSLLDQAQATYGMVGLGPFQARALIRKGIVESTEGTTASQLAGIADLNSAASDPAASALEKQEALYRSGLVQMARTDIPEGTRLSNALAAFAGASAINALRLPQTHAQGIGLGPSFFPGSAQLGAALAFAQKVSPEPDNSFADEAALGRGLAKFFSTSDFSNALAEFNQFLSTQPSRFPATNGLDLAHFYAGECQRLLGRFDQALGEYNQVHAPPLFENARAGVAQVLLAQLVGDSTRAMRPPEFAANLEGVARDTARLSGTPFSLGIKSAIQILDALVAESIPIPVTIVQGLPPRRLTRGAPYTLGLTAIGGALPLTFAATGLPAGLALDTTRGIITGTPSAAGVFDPIVTVRDATGDSDARTLTLHVDAMSIDTPPQLPEPIVGQTYGVTLTALGGNPPLSWRLAEGSLPAGISLDGLTGAITSAGPVPGSVDASRTAFQILLTDSAGAEAQKAFVLAGSAAPPVFPAVVAQRAPQFDAGALVQRARRLAPSAGGPAIVTFPTGGVSPVDEAVTSDGKLLYVAHAFPPAGFRGSVTQVDLDSGVSTTLLAPPAPANSDFIHVAVVEPSAAPRVVCAVRNGVTFLDVLFPQTSTAFTRAIGETVLRVGSTPDRTRILVVTDQALHVLDATNPVAGSDRRIPLVPSGGFNVTSQATILDYSGSLMATDHRAFVSNGQQTGAASVFACDLDEGVATRLENAGMPGGCLLTPDGTTGLAFSGNTRAVTVYDVGRGTSTGVSIPGAFGNDLVQFGVFLTPAMPVGVAPLACAISPDGRLAAVCFGGRGSSRPTNLGPQSTSELASLLFSVSFIDVGEREISSEFLIDQIPFDVAFTADGRRALVAEATSFGLQVIDLSSFDPGGNGQIGSLAATRYDLPALPIRVLERPSHAQAVGITQGFMRPLATPDSVFEVDLTRTNSTVTESVPQILRAPLPPATQGVAYTGPGGGPVSVAARGGSGAYVFTDLSGGSPAPGMTLASSGTVAGTPTQAGLFTFSVGMLDTNAQGGKTPLHDRRDVRLLVHPASQPPSPPLLFAPASTLVPIGSAFTTTLQVVGGALPFSFSRVLPDVLTPLGLSLTSNGVLSGPAVGLRRGRAQQGIAVTDGAGRTSTAMFNVEVADVATVSLAAPVPLAAGLTTSTATAAPGPVGTVSELSLSLDLLYPSLSGSSFNDGLVSIIFGSQAGIQPASFLAIDPPLTAHGMRTVFPDIQLPDESLDELAGSPIDQPFNLNVIDTTFNAARGATILGWTLTANLGLRLRTQALPPATVGTAYSFNLVTTGGRAPITFAPVALPGMNLSLAGTLSGTPAAAGTTSVTVTVTDASGTVVARAIDFIVNAAPAAAPLPPTVPSGTFLVPGIEGAAVASSSHEFYFVERSQTAYQDDLVHEASLDALLAGASSKLVVTRSTVLGRGVRPPVLSADESHLFVPSDDNTTAEHESTPAHVQDVIVPALVAGNVGRDAGLFGSTVDLLQEPLVASAGPVLFFGGLDVAFAFQPFPSQSSNVFSIGKLTSMVANPIQGGQFSVYTDGEDSAAGPFRVFFLQVFPPDGSITGGQNSVEAYNGHGGVAVSPDGSVVYFAASDPVAVNSRLFFIDPVQLQAGNPSQLSSIGVANLVQAGSTEGLRSVHLGLTPDGKYLYCPMSRPLPLPVQGGVQVVDVVNKVLFQTITIPGMTTPHQCVVAPDGKSVLVVSRQDHMLAVLKAP